MKNLTLPALTLAVALTTTTTFAAEPASEGYFDRAREVTMQALSFLGVGMPITQPSLGALIRIGNQYLFSGDWWLVLFPSAQLGLIVLSVNLLGDWLRDALNPKLR